MVLFRPNEARKLFLYFVLKNGIHSPSKRFGGNSFGKKTKRKKKMKKIIKCQQMIRCKEVLLGKDWRKINLLRAAGLQEDCSG